MVTTVGRFRAIVLAVGLAAAGITAPPARAAQDATPVSATIADACRIDPLPLPIALPRPTPGATSVALLPDPAALPLGEPTDAATVAAVTVTVQEAIACRNAGDLRRAYALMTPAMHAGLIGSAETAPPEIVALLLQGEDPVPPEGRVRLLGVTEIARLPDGRLRARVETEAAGFRFTDLLLFAPDAATGRWLIDDALPLGRQPLP